MSGERSEQPTAKKLKKFRDEGRVAKSQDLGSLLGLFMGVYLLAIYAPGIGSALLDSMRHSYTTLGRLQPQAMTYTQVLELFVTPLKEAALAIGPWMIALVVVGIGVNVVQTRGLVQPKLLIPKWERLNYLKKAKQMFGKQLLVETVKGLAKQAMVILIIYLTISAQMGSLFGAAQLGLGPGIANLSRVIYTMAMQVAAVLLVIAFLDYLWQWRQHRNSLMMSVQEVRDESKQSEGSPEVKGRIRRIQREMAQRRMMQEVPTADAVVVNPTHYAAAIKYDGSTMQAPKLVAKGVDATALRIIALARQHGIPVVPNKPLARALYKLPLDATIPPEFFQAVAEVLAFVYNLKNPRRSRER
jgi:flagellar biosynthetic protein FlhB